jgi:glutamate transport system permease protein
MDILVENAGAILGGFGLTLRLLAVSAICSSLLGTVLAVMRVCPIGVLRLAGTWYVEVVRNTPIVMLFVVVYYGLPEVGIDLSFFASAVVALSCYTASFVCEVLRSGVNSVQAGQAEAARAIGLTFVQSVSLIVLPQAVRTVIAPLASVFIALLKNTAIAEVFGMTEATFQLDSLIRDNPGALFPIFLGIASGYVVLAFAISSAARFLESRSAVLR